jgi:hypothetical protein
MPVWEVSRLPERDQFDYWHEVICQAFVPLTPGRKDAGPGFPSTVETQPLISINRARIASRAQTTRHGPREVAATDDAFYFVNLQLAGRCRTRVGTSDTVVRPGQFVVVDTTQPYYFDFEDDWRMLSFRVPHQLLGSGPAPRVGVPVDGHGVGGVVTALMRALWEVDGTVAGPAVGLSGGSSRRPARGGDAARPGAHRRQLAVGDERLPSLRDLAPDAAQPVRGRGRELRGHGARAAPGPESARARRPEHDRDGRRGRWGARLRRSDDVHPRLPAAVRQPAHRRPGR